MSRSAVIELSLWKWPPKPRWYPSDAMRITIGLRYWSLLKNCRLAASPRIWSQALWKYARYWISGNGSMPMFA